MGRIAAALIAAVVLAAPQAAAKEGPMVPSRLLGFVAQGKKLSVVKLNASTLAPVSKALPTGSADVAYVARSPGRGTRVAFAAGASSLRFLDRTHMRWDGRVAFPGRPATALWNYANKLVTLTETAQVVVVDPTKRRLRAQRSVGGTLGAYAATGDRIVAVVAPLDGIGPAKLAVIDDAGRARIAPLPQIRAGSETLENGSVFRYEWPALAVDPSGTQAAVVSAQGTIVAVNLDTLAASAHGARTLAAARKNANGSHRTAQWTLSGTVAVTGTDTSFDGTSERTTPAGLTLLDTRNWSARTVDADTSELAYSPITDVLLAYGRNGLARYDPDGTQRFRLNTVAAMNPRFEAGTYVYFMARNATHFTIVDGWAGIVVKTVDTRTPTVLAAM
jgi:hypothetical protein